MAEVIKQELDWKDHREAELMWTVYGTVPRKGKVHKFEDFRARKIKSSPQKPQSPEVLLAKVTAITKAMGGTIIN